MSTFKNGHMPDTQGNSRDGLEGDLAQGSATTGASGGALGDCSLSDLDGSQGYHKLDSDGRSLTEQREGDEAGYAPTQVGGGFAGRPGGWER